MPIEQSKRSRMRQRRGGATAARTASRRSLVLAAALAVALAAGGHDTGVRIEVRAGGPAVGFQSSAALMYQDPDITLGMLQTDEIVQFSKTQPVVGVMAPL